MSCNVIRPKNNTIVNSVVTCEDVIKLSTTYLMHDAPGREGSVIVHLSLIHPYMHLYSTRTMADSAE